MEFSSYLYISFFLFSSSLSLTIEDNNFQRVLYKDLQQTSNTFFQEDITSYSQILFDVARDQVLVGARDILYRLSLGNLTLLETANWMADEEKQMQCGTKGQSDELCHNYIKILLTTSNEQFLYSCGTNAFSPLCSVRKMENISQVISWIDGVGKGPYSPEANVTSLMSESGDYYFGGPSDFSNSDYLISRTTPNNTIIRTKQSDSLSLNNPQFVGSFETPSFVYFLFREVAVEYINCGKVVYSRIARVCKNDGGHASVNRGHWSTFLKARLNCSLPGAYPFYFNEIHSMSYAPAHRLLYATFQTPPNAIAGAAICAFHLDDIEAAFAGPFKHQETINSAWRREQSRDRAHFECRPSAHLAESSKYQLMDNAVQARSLRPLHTANLERFTQITYDTVQTRYGRVDVIFVATSEGRVKKLTHFPRQNLTCLIEVFEVAPNASVQVRSMQYLRETNSIYVATDVALLRVSVAHCGRHSTRESCVNAQDPYCGWYELEEACTGARSGGAWLQRVAGCPDAHAPADGGWGAWSGWGECAHADANATCECRTRDCDNPRPRHGGAPCGGARVGVRRCTAHGGWSEWSAWSACSATCGAAVRTRTRSCTNPAPAFGGRVCVGQERAEAMCMGIPPCPPAPVNGGWGAWGEWEACVGECKQGMREKRRRCDSPPPANGGAECVGERTMSELCFNHCTTQGNQTRWMVVNEGGGEVKKRFRFECTIGSGAQASTRLEEETEYCGAAGCAHSEHKRWSNWTECSATCGQGVQKRVKLCKGRPCATETRGCRRRPCESLWSCWSDWSPCNVSCGWGVRTRTRHCLEEGRCEGVAQEEQPCEERPCHSDYGWGNWTSWSLCDQNNQQYRSRQCRVLKPTGKVCQGSGVEARMCVLSPLISNEINQLQVASFNGVLIYFLLGIASAVAGAALMYYYLKRSFKQNEPVKRLSVCKPAVKKNNLYTAVPTSASNKSKCSDDCNSKVFQDDRYC